MNFYLWMLLVVVPFMGFWIILGILNAWMWDHGAHGWIDPADDQWEKRF